MESLVVRSFEHQVDLLPGVTRLEGPVWLERYPSPVIEGAEVLVLTGPVDYSEGFDHGPFQGIGQAAQAQPAGQEDPRRVDSS
jgi:hypothetical protein